MQFEALRDWRDRLGRVADFIAAIKDTPPFFATRGDFLAAAERQDWRRRGALALDEKKIHHTPKKHD